MAAAITAAASTEAASARLTDPPFGCSTGGRPVSSLSASRGLFLVAQLEGVLSAADVVCERGHSTELKRAGPQTLSGQAPDDGVASRVDPATPLMVGSGRAMELDGVRGFDRSTDAGSAAGCHER